MLDLSDGNGRPRQWTIILGDNGVGKTTLLQCLAGLQADDSSWFNQMTSSAMPKLFSIGESYVDELLHVPELRVGGRFRIDSAIFVGAISGPTNSTASSHKWSVEGNATFRSAGIVIWDTRSVVCYGYGASRRMGNVALSDSQSTDSIVSLFDDNATLINAEEWLLQADYAAKSLTGTEQRRAEQRRDRIREVLIRLLPDVSDLQFVPTSTTPIRTTVRAKTPYGWVPIRNMSLGYKTLMAWMVDFASRMFERYPDSPDPLAEPAIVLVDEIDLHLHPRWQRSLMQFLTNLFPQTQFIVSAHSPLIVQAAADANVVLLRREGDHVVIDNDVQAIKGWRVDQVLTSDLFGLDSARPPQLDDALRERTRLLSKARLTAKDRARLSELESQIGSLPTGETPQDIDAMDIIRRAAELLKKQE